MTVLTKRFVEAVDYARDAHAGQTRKGTDIPYIYHLLGVASLVIAYGGSEEQAIAAMLHDVIEDCGAGHELAIRTQFGDGVASIVRDCTDGTAEGKAMHTDLDAKRRDWLVRKLAHLAHVRQEPAESLLVSACDKLHNARAIVEDLEDPAIGAAVFDRFTPTREQTLGYYQALGEILTERSSPVAHAFEHEVAQMYAHAGVSHRASLWELSAASEVR